MPRPRRQDAGEVKRRSRTGCWPCKGRKVKCGEERPTCGNCSKTGVKCDYSIRLNWEGRRKKRPEIGGILDFGSTSSGSAPISASASTSSAAKSETSSTHTIVKSEPHPSPPLRQHPLPNAPLHRSSFDPPMVSPHTEFMSAVLPPMPQSELSPPDGAFQVPRPRSFSQPSQSLGGRPSNLNLPPLDTGGAGSAPQFHDPFGPWLPDGTPRMNQSSLGTITELASPSPMHFQPPGSQPPILSPTLPMTPGAFSESSSAHGQFSARPSLIPGCMPEPDNRRGLSVNALLSGPPSRQDSNQFPQLAAGHVLFEHDLKDQDPMIFHGIDKGYEDLDLGRNDDANAISQDKSPVSNRQGKGDSYFRGSTPRASTPTAEFGFGVNLNDNSKDDNYYYRKPVDIFIPRSFNPLPKKLSENSMNLVYFHHFLNHTAHVLVPHDDPNSNPFRTILPEMAIKNDNLLSLLLAYSASHRARLLQQPEPATRIAHWVEDIFPALRQALNDPNEIISNANLATAIMLASLEIISPRAFGYEISWQKHLSLARDLITTRPGGLRRMQSRSRDDPLCSFLWSWFAYLDVLGSLSGGRAHPHTTDESAANKTSTAWLLDYDDGPSPSPSSHASPATSLAPGGDRFASNPATTATSPANSTGTPAPGPSPLRDDDPRDEIDCIMGFTTRCVAILARIADLARRTDSQRIAGPGRVVEGWRPIPEIESRARKLEEDLRSSLARPHRPCQHHVHSAGRWDAEEMKATNEAFHWAGLVHLHRRVLGKPSGDGDVQQAVRKIAGCLEKVKRGGNAEACLLFPLFTAGCDTRGEEARNKLLGRVMSVESSGMTQVHRARTLMQRVWTTGQPWETLISTEFIG